MIVVQDWLKNNIPHFWDTISGPPIPPYANPCDYYL